MPIYNFDERFAPLVESGQKRQTIRRGCRSAERGATAHLWQKTPYSRKLGEGTITTVKPIEIGRNGCGEPYACLCYSHRTFSNTLVHYHLDAFAKEDGFSNGEEMVAWFEDKYGLPFEGYLHMWEMQIS